jgi:hypothetical protein
MQSYGETPIIHALTQGKGSSTGYKPSNSSRTDAINGKQTLPAVQCTYCKMFGHKHVSCHKMAIWLILQEHAAKMDDKFKAQLIHDYRKAMEDKQKSKLSKFQGTVRQLYIDGNIERAEEVLADMFHQLDNTQMVCDSDENEDQNKHTES